MFGTKRLVHCVLGIVSMSTPACWQAIPTEGVSPIQDDTRQRSGKSSAARPPPKRLGSFQMALDMTLPAERGGRAVCAADGPELIRPRLLAAPSSSNT